MSNSPMTPPPPYYAAPAAPEPSQPKNTLAIVTFAVTIGWHVISTALYWTFREETTIISFLGYVSAVGFGVTLTLGVLALRTKALRRLTSVAVGISILNIFYGIFSVFADLYLWISNMT